MNPPSASPVPVRPSHFIRLRRRLIHPSLAVSGASCGTGSTPRLILAPVLAFVLALHLSPPLLAADTASAAPSPAARPAPAASATTPATTAPPAPAPAAAPEPSGGGSPRAVAALREIVSQQKAALARAREAEDQAEIDDLRPRLQKVVAGYETLLKEHPDFAAAWTAYGLFLCDPLVEDRRTALALLLKANRLDPDLPVVKNQIGVLLAEDGRAIDALNYFLAASDLAPAEPLYHFQIGLVLDEARDHFTKSGAWSPATIDSTIVSSFARAVTLAPERTDFAYRAAEAYGTLAEPRWDLAYAAWSSLEDRLEEKLARQTVRLHRARARWQQGLAGEARELLATVDEPSLAVQKAKLEAEFAAEEAVETQGAPQPPPASKPANTPPAAVPTGK